MDRDESRIANLLGALALALTDAIREQTGRAGGVGPSGAAALATIVTYPGEPLDALARTLGLSAAGASRLADRLQADELIRRQGGGPDGRSRTLVPTDAGTSRARKVLAARRSALERALSALSDAQAAALAPLLETMLTALTPDRRTCDHICRLCEIAACPQDICPVELAALREEAG